MNRAIKMALLRSALGVFIIEALNGPVLAQGADFEKRKAEHLARIDERLQKLQQHRSCVSSAASAEDLRKCGDVMREWRKDERDERQERREERRKP